MSEINGYQQAVPPITVGGVSYEYYWQNNSGNSVALPVAIINSTATTGAAYDPYNVVFVPQPNVTYYTASQGAPQNPIVPSNILVPQATTNPVVTTPSYTHPGGNPAPVPEPGTWLMLATAMVLIMLSRKWAHRAKRAIAVTK